jgi:2-keto-4-pentenoate hydratase
MDPATIRQAAEQLVAARRTRQLLDKLPDALRPQTFEDGFAIQDAVMALLGERPGGWKVGVSPNAPATCAPMFASLFHASPVNLPAASVPLLGVEGEIAVRIGRDLPKRATPYTRDDIVAAIDGVCAAIEVVDSRFKAFLKLGPEDKLADNVGNGGFVTGPMVTDWQKLDLSKLPVVLEVGGKTLTDKVGGSPSGDPLVAVVWLANHLTGRDGGLKKGQIVTTGSCTGLPFAKPGDTAIVRFAGLGEARVTFTA